MRTVKLQGGLGNQLFGLALAHSIMRITGEAPVLDISSFATDSYGRRFEFPDLVHEMGFATVRSPWGRPLIGRIARRLPFFKLVKEASPPGDVEDLKQLLMSKAYFDGYWQDERFFADPVSFRDAVRADVSRRASLHSEPFDVVVHFRTYEEEHLAARRSTPPPDYFSSALDAAGVNEPRARRLLISDNPDRAKIHLEPLGFEWEVRSAQLASPFDDLWAIMNARSAVLSNSSFSWWGGYCSTAKKIIYPKSRDFFHYAAPAEKFLLI